jgi:hypothetical protein
METIVGLMLGAWIGFGVAMTQAKTNEEIVKHGCAYYDANTGDFTWRVNDEEKTKSSTKNSK